MRMTNLAIRFYRLLSTNNMTNRILKFRAWTGDTMIYQDHNTASCMNGLERFTQMVGAVQGCTPNVMQFTGLSDKAGRDIYEGDIVQDRFLKYEVMWSDLQARWVIALPTSEASIIGNIHETPELGGGLT